MAPPLNGSADENFNAFGNFDLVKRVKLDYTDVVVSKWQSRVTGLTVVHLDYEGIRFLIPATFVHQYHSQHPSSMATLLLVPKVSVTQGYELTQGTDYMHNSL